MNELVGKPVLYVDIMSKVGHQDAKFLLQVRAYEI